MAVTENLYTGDNSTVLFSFTFPYLQESDVKVSLDGTLTTAYSLANATTVQFNTAPASGVVVRIYRVTDNDEARAEFYPGSAIRSQDLNNNFEQILYVTQETSRDQALLETYVDDTFVEDARVHFTGDTWSNTDDYNIPTVQAVSDRLTALRDSGFWDTRYFTESELLSGIALDSVYVNRNWFRTSNFSFNASDLWFPSTRWIDTYYYTKAELDAGQLDSQYVQTYNQPVFVRPSTIAWGSFDTNVPTGLAVDNRIIQLKDIGTFDDRYYTEAEADARYWNVDSAEYIDSGDTWTPDDQHIATTAAIEARIVTLVDDVGGFVPISTYTAFPTTNPDPSNGPGTVVSIQNITGLTHSGGTSTNAATTGATPVTITGIPAGLVSPVPEDFGMLVITTSTLNTYTFHRLVAPASDVVDVASNATNINTVAGQISPTNRIKTVSDNINSVSTTANNISNVNTVATNVFAVGTVSTNISRVNNVGNSIGAVNSVANSLNAVISNANNISSIQTVAGSIANVDNVGGSIANVNTVATNVADVNTVATDIADVTAVSTNIGAVAAVGSDLANSFSNIDDYGGITDPVTSTPAGTSDIQTVATNISNVNTVAAINAGVTTVAGISSNVTTVATNNANVTTVATDIANVNTNAASIANINTVAGISANVTTVAGNTANINAVAADATDIGTVASNIANVNAVGTDIASVNTAATNIAAIIAAPTEAANAAASASAAATSETNAAASATNAATSATAAATSESNAATSAGNAATSETNALASATAAASSAAAALVSETNADNSADLALQYRDDTAGLLTQADSDPFNVSTNQSWGDIIAGAASHFVNEVLADILLTMSKGTNTYDYGTL